MATYTRNENATTAWVMAVPNHFDTPPVWTESNLVSSTVIRFGNVDGTITEFRGSGFQYISGNSGAGTITSVVRTGADHTTIYESITGLSYALDPIVKGLSSVSLPAYLLAGNDSITGNSLNEGLFGGAGNDTINGGGGIDIIDGDGGAFVVSAGQLLPDGSVATGTVTYAAGDDYLIGGGGNDNITGGRGNDTLEGGLGNDFLVGNDAGNSAPGYVFQADFNTLLGGDGDDVLFAQIGTWGANEATDPYAFAGGVIAKGGLGTDTLIANFSYISQAININAKNTNAVNVLPDGSLITGIEQLRIELGSGDDVVREGAEIDRIWTGAGNDTVYYGGGVFNGLGAGIDLGSGDDKLVAAGVILTAFGGGGGFLNAGSGFDQLVYDLSSFAVPVHMQYGVDYLGGFEKIIATGGSANDTVGGGPGDDILRGGAGNDLLVDNAGNDFLDGGAGGDTMAGGNGDDTYIVDSAGDIISESGTTGTDLVKVTFSFTLGADFENLTLLDGAITGTGNDAVNRITGNGAANTLSGGAGADTLIGGAGDDTYIVDNAGDRVVELGAGGTDLVQSSVTRALGANQENLQLTGIAGIKGIGNDLANIITGNAGANLLDGKGGADMLAGGAGDDIYIVDDENDEVTEEAGQGNDLVKSSVSFSLTADVERLTLLGGADIDGAGNGLANLLTGNSGANELHGGDGADRLYGKAGADVLYGDQGFDRFYFDTPLGAGNVDTIADFQRGEDDIVLDRDFFAGVGNPGAMLSGVFTGKIVYDASSGALSYDADGVGIGAAAVQFAIVGLDVHPTSLSADDFAIVA